MVTVTDKTEEELWQEQIEKIAALLITNSLVQVITDDDIEILFLNTPPF